MSGGSARTIRRYSVELWQNLVLHGIRKSTSQHLTVNWNFDELEMALKTFHIVPGLSRTPLLFILRYLTNIFFKNMLQKKNNLENRKSGNLKNRSWKVKVSSFVSAGTVWLASGAATATSGHPALFSLASQKRTKRMKCSPAPHQ